MLTQCDLFLFAGQSNMAGRGVCTARWPQGAPACTPGAGYEYRAVSDPDCLHPLAEPFGADENDPAGIFEPGKKTGSLVAAFVNACYAQTGVPVVGVSASKGGAPIAVWQGRGDLLSDALRRLERARRFLAGQGTTVRHCFALWCQGETDGDLATPPQAYRAAFLAMLGQLLQAGVEMCFLITIGAYNGPAGYDYAPIRQVQLEMAAQDPNLCLVCDDLHTMRGRGLMKDAYHYYQQAYNEVGTAAGTAAGAWIRGHSRVGKNGSRCAP